jgi:uncharacterized protein with NAD-binding domain and iron-sulfur cluster
MELPPMVARSERRLTPRARVAVLGGGCGGIAAAFALTATPELRTRFEVTLFQEGFRLGGKGAASRNARRGRRIEEHGLHVWMGFYRRAFRALHRCYEEWNPPPNAPFRRLADAFSPHGRLSFELGPARRGQPQVWDITLPNTSRYPWDEADDAIDPAQARARWADWLRSLGLALRTAPRDLGPHARLLFALARGLALDVARRGWDAIDEEDLAAWLQRHGAGPGGHHPVVRGLYALAFATPGLGANAGMAAGTALQAAAKILFTYRGAAFWRMRGGMGDTVFAPLYQVLRERGVRFEFFHRVKRLIPSGHRLGSIELTVQARPGRNYDPLVSVRGLPAWPDAPTAASALAHSDDAAAGTRTLRCGEDFDAAVLAIPSPCHAEIAAPLLELSDGWRRAVEMTRSVATFAAQLWLRAPLSELGWGGPPTICTAGPPPLGTWADMSEVLAAEDWPEHDRPRAVVYLCDVLDEERGVKLGPTATLSRVLDERLVRLWPGAADAQGRFRRDLLVSDGEEDPLFAQYVRFNRDPSERYILSPPGTTAHRIAPGESGVDGLVLAGDWTRSRINGGSVEAAFESGEEAARVLIERYG